MSAGSVQVVFRLDDISAVSDGEVERAIFDIFFRRGIPLTVGAIPYLVEGDVHEPGTRGEIELPREKLAFLAECRERGGFEIAQHGCTHQVREGVGFRTEFSGLSEAGQSTRIARGKTLLASRFSVTSFIPPWNSYDVATLLALQALGFRAISGDLFGPLDPRARLQFLPATTSLAGVRDALEAAHAAKAERRLVVVLMHAYDFRESGSERARHDFGELDAVLRELPGGREWSYETLESCATVGGFGAGALLAAKRRARIARHLPAIFRKAWAPEGVALYGKPSGFRRIGNHPSNQNA